MKVVSFQTNRNSTFIPPENLTEGRRHLVDQCNLLKQFCFVRKRKLVGLDRSEKGFLFKYFFRSQSKLKYSLVGNVVLACLQVYTEIF